jgi:hypothetical protein
VARRGFRGLAAGQRCRRQLLTRDAHERDTLEPVDTVDRTGELALALALHHRADLDGLHRPCRRRLAAGQLGQAPDMGGLGRGGEPGQTTQPLDDRAPAAVGPDDPEGIGLVEPPVARTLGEEQGRAREPVTVKVAALPHLLVEVTAEHAGDRSPLDGAAGVTDAMRADQGHGRRGFREGAVDVGQRCDHLVEVALGEPRARDRVPRLGVDDAPQSCLRRLELPTGATDQQETRIVVREGHVESLPQRARERRCVQGLLGPRTRVLDEHPATGDRRRAGERLVPLGRAHGAATGVQGHDLDASSLRAPARILGRSGAPVRVRRASGPLQALEHVVAPLNADGQRVCQRCKPNGIPTFTCESCGNTVTTVGRMDGKRVCLNCFPRRLRREGVKFSV